MHKRISENYINKIKQTILKRNNTNSALSEDNNIELKLIRKRQDKGAKQFIYKIEKR